MELTKEEAIIIIDSLNCRLCIIETGDYILRANDAINCKMTEKIKLLSPYQRELIMTIENIINKLLPKV